MSTPFDVAVIGEGIAGLTAAGHVASLRTSVATFEGAVFGGLVLNVASLNGFGDGASGIDVAAALSESNSNAGVQSVAATVTAIHPKEGRFVLEADGEPYEARRVILATGARARSLGLPDEERLYHRGISRCADCDGPLYAGQPVAVVGGGDAAFMQAASLGQVAGEVHVFVRGRAPRARKEFVDAVAAMPNVHVLPDAHVVALHGGDALEAVDVEVAGARRRFNVPGLFIYIGADAASELAAGLAELDAAGSVVASAEGVTTLPGLYAVGAVRSGYGGRLAQATDEARRCAEHAVRSLRRDTFS